MRTPIKVEDLYLALDNPRLTESNSENEELEKLVSEEGQKLVALAEDIIEHGLNPLDTIGVYPSENNQGKYIVAEGNRRVAVVKILNNITLIERYDKSVYTKFSRLQRIYKPILTMDVWIFGNGADPALLHWIEIKHMGEQKGKGTSTWNSLQKERFDQKVRGENRLLDFWSDLEKYSILTGDEILSITKTNWERILRDIGIDFLGICKVGMRLMIPIDDLINFTQKIRCIQRNLAHKTVGIVYDQEKIKIFFDTISMELYGEKINVHEQLTIPSKTNGEEIDILLATGQMPESTAGARQIQQNQKSGDDAVSTATRTPSHRDLFNGCNTTIPAGYTIRSSNARINMIIMELKTLLTDQNPNACGVLLRVLFELAAKQYIESRTGEDRTGTEFQQIINHAANELIKSQSIGDQEYAALKADLDTLRLLFNGYAHNTDSYPSTEAIKNIFKAHKKFLVECLK